MARVILGIVVGFIVWSVLWVGSDAIFSAISPDWYGSNLNELAAAMEKKTTGYRADSTLLIIGLLRSVIFSLISGFVAASIAGENAKSTLGLGVLLLLFGAVVQIVYWNYVPIWYNIPFLLLLVPMTVLGGKLKKS